MKKPFILLLTACVMSLSIGLVACGEEGKNHIPDEGQQQEQQQPEQNPSGGSSQEQQKPNGDSGSQEQQKPSEGSDLQQGGNEQGDSQQGGSQNEQPHEHDWGEWEVTKEATCSQKGEEERVCKTDSSHKENRDIEIDPKAHDWDEGKVTKEPNCKEEGEFTYTCKNSEEHTKTEKIPSDSDAHVWDEEGKCSVCGKWSFTPGLKYKLNPDDDSYYVSGIGSVTEKDIVLPSSYDGKPVTKIGEAAFKDYKGLESITIPDSVTKIGEGAFSNCNNLKSITIPNGVTTIGELAFSGCDDLQRVDITDLAAWCEIQFADDGANPLSYSHRLFINGTVVTDLEIPDSVTAISDYAFYDCTGLESVTIPDSVTTIGELAFSGCDGLQRVDITDLAAWCEIQFADNGANPLSYSHRLFIDGTEVSGLFIPDSVTAISDYAFYHCTSLESITIPDSVKTIGDWAFSFCTSSESIAIGNGVTEIDDYAFSYCYSLISITIPNSVTKIGEDAFNGCESLESIAIGNGVTEIDDHAFSFCYSLTSITIPNSVKTIGDWAFHGCVRLVEVVNLSGRSLDEWEDVLDIYTSANYKSKIKRQDGLVFYEGDEVTYLIDYEGDETEITLPETFNGKTYEIRKFAFYMRINLKSVTIPDSVTTIGELAFNGCASLDSVTFKNTKGWTINGKEVKVDDSKKNAELLKANSMGTWYRS